VVDWRLLLHGDVLIDRSALSAVLPGAWAEVLHAGYGGEREMWSHAYRQVAEDWESYWADLDLNGDDSVEQWREGRWRTVRAWFRLAGQSLPTEDQIPYFLDTLTESAGEYSQAWRKGAVEVLRELEQMGLRATIVDPYAPAPLVRGMLLGCCEGQYQVIGPDEMGQVGLDGIAWGWLTSLAGADPERTRFVTPHLMRGGNIIQPPTDLVALVPLITQEMPFNTA
jgi:hypothetical protein